jgi:ADP-ribosylglycohydrolase
MTFETLPLTARTLKATESRLKAIYDAAGLGLSGDSLALAAGMMPIEYRRLCDLDPLAALAAQKGKADAEAEMAGVIKKAALAGDAKIALEFLKHRADWVAKQQVQVDVRQQISVLAALEQAQGRVIEGQLEHQPSASIPLSLQPERQAAI